jgi:RNA polymerase sigma-54 factor
MLQLNQTLNQRLEQKMILAPRMIQSMEILQLPVLALQERIEQELEENPVLELREAAPEEVPPAEDEGPDPDGPLISDADNALDFNRLDELTRNYSESFDEDHRPSRSGIDEEGDRKHDAMQNMPARPRSLRDHLIEQLTFLDVDPEQHDLLTYVISHIDGNGYLADHRVDDSGNEIVRPFTVDELVTNYAKPVSAAEMEGAIALIQRLDPPGVGARDLRECLLLQLTPETPNRELLFALIVNHLEDIQNNRLPLIEKKTNQSIPALKEAIAQLRRLDPKPGTRISSQSAQPIVPDVIVEMNDQGEYDVRLVDDWTPELHIPRRFFELYKNKSADPKTREYLKRKLQSAEWLIDAIRQRRNTLEKVTRAIIQHQRAFLDKGVEFIEPLKMQQIADQVRVHVTTVSRAVDDKWALTPRGLFPLKRFFGGGTKNEVTGEDVAYETIKNKLLELIAAEDKSNPLSDEELVEKLNASGYPVARRTVTKYRKMLDIPSSRQRKDWAKG